VAERADSREAHSTKQRLLDAGQAMLLEQGYNDLGVQALLEATGTPKGSFYHHFENKEAFALQVIDQYMRQVHQALDACLGEQARPPLERVRRFFELVAQNYRKEGYLGCLLGGLGQELSGVSEVFRRKVEACFSAIAGRLAVCLEEARRLGDLPADAHPRQMASRLVDCWEGAPSRSPPCSTSTSTRPAATVGRRAPRSIAVSAELTNQRSTVAMCAWILPSSGPDPNRREIASAATLVALPSRAAPCASISCRSGFPWQ
jgi:TetR/AcrR family transcriptional repressor of nem operon